MNTELLPRFAAADQWLAKNHPDAPRLYEWISFTHDSWWVTDTTPNLQNYITNPAACLCGAVVWAMGVAQWNFTENGVILTTETIDGNMIMHLIDPDEGEDGVVCVIEDTIEEAWCSTIESICTSLGRNPDAN